jgi:hypothetical protein
LPCELCGSLVDVRNPKVFAKKLVLGLDKSASLVYNISMRNKTTSTKENEMKDTITQLQTYQGSLVRVIRFSRYWNEATVCFVTPVGKQQTGTFKVGLPRLKNLPKFNKKVKKN